MSDLTRRVIEAQKRRESILNTLNNPDSLHEDGMLREYHQAGDAMMKATPILVRQVEAVEALAGHLEHEAAYQASQGDTWDAECLRSEARRIRAALTDAEEQAD